MKFANLTQAKQSTNHALSQVQEDKRGPHVEYNNTFVPTKITTHSG